MAVAQSTEAIVLDWSQPPDEPPAPESAAPEPGSWEAYAETPAYGVESAYRQAQWDDPSRGGSGTDFATFDWMQESPDWGRKPAQEVFTAQHPEISEKLGEIESFMDPWEERATARSLAFLPRDVFEDTEPLRKTTLLSRDMLPDNIGGLYVPAGYTPWAPAVVSAPGYGVFTHELFHHADMSQGNRWSDDPEFVDLIANMPQDRRDLYAERWGEYYGPHYSAMMPKEVIAEEATYLSLRGSTVTPEITEYLANNVVRSRPTADNPYLQRSAMFDRYEAYRSYDQRVREMLANRR